MRMNESNLSQAIRRPRAEFCSCKATWAQPRQSQRSGPEQSRAIIKEADGMEGNAANATKQGSLITRRSRCPDSLAGSISPQASPSWALCQRFGGCSVHASTQRRNRSDLNSQSKLAHPNKRCAACVHTDRHDKRARLNRYFNPPLLRFRTQTASLAPPIHHVAPEEVLQP